MDPKHFGTNPVQPQLDKEKIDKPIDGTKFKEVLKKDNNYRVEKVDESDDTQKRHQRNRTKNVEDPDETQDATPQVIPGAEFKGLMGDTKKDAGVLGVQEFEASQGRGTPRLGGEFQAGDSSADEGDFDTKDQVSQQSGQYAPQQGSAPNPNIPPEEQPSLPPGEDYSEEGDFEAPESNLSAPTDQTGTTQQQSSTQTTPEQNKDLHAKPKHVVGTKTESGVAPKGASTPKAKGEAEQKVSDTDETPHPLAATQTPQRCRG